MWRIALVAVGGWIGYRLAKTGKSHTNMVVATLSAMLVYRLTKSRMAAETSKNEIAGQIAGMAREARAKQVEIEVLDAE